MSSDKRFVRRRIGVCGSFKRLWRRPNDLCESIGRCLARSHNVTIVSGSAKPHAAEGLVVNAAAATMTREETEDRIVSFVDAIDTGKGDFVGSPEYAKGKTSEARRISFVKSLDALIAVCGRGGTRQELALAIEFGTRILPIPGFGGAAADVWKAYKAEIMKALRIDENTAQRWENVAALDSVDYESVAEQMVNALLRSLPRRCFVIMPYEETFRPLYDMVLQPAIASAGDDPIDIRSIGAPGIVTDQIESGLRTCDYAIAVLDGLRHNVMYELGMAHANRKTVILVNRKGSLDNGQTPFDISTHQRLEYTELDAAIRDRLRQTIQNLVTGLT